LPIRAPAIERKSLVRLVLLGCLFVFAPAPAAVFSAEAVKAAFLFRFASFVQWPSDVPTEGPFIIGVVGGDPVADQLERLLPGMSVRGQSAQVRRVTKPAELAGVRILYVGPDAGARWRAVRAEASTLPILVVTDRADNFDDGGVINFVDAPRNVRFEVSLIAADRARLTIDSALLAVAARVERRIGAARACDFCELVAEAH